MKVTFIGGGSAKFVGALVRDLFTFDALHDSQICLMDIDSDRLARSERLVKKIIADLKLPAKVSSTTDQRAAIAGSDYVIVTVMVGGFSAYESDGAIPCKYGVIPSVGDTIGPGAVMRLIRTAPVVQEIVKNIREVAPNAWVFNYTNPMAMLTWLFLSLGQRRTVGLCHSIQGDYRLIAKALGVPPEQVQYTAGGINHIDFYLTLTHNGENLYLRLLAQKEKLLVEHPDWRVKFELLEYLGGWPAEGPWHQTEYYPWFAKNRDVVEKQYGVEAMWGFKFDKQLNMGLDEDTEEMIAGRKPIDYRRSHEYGAWMIDSIRTNTTRLVYANVRNEGWIPNLPPQGVVEVPCDVDGRGVIPRKIDALPLPLAAVMTPHILCHEMAVQSVLQKDLRLVRQAIQSDPLTGAILTLPQIDAMVRELLEANRQYVNRWV